MTLPMSRTVLKKKRSLLGSFWTTLFLLVCPLSPLIIQHDTSFHHVDHSSKQPTFYSLSWTSTSSMLVSADQSILYDYSTQSANPWTVPTAVACGGAVVYTALCFRIVTTGDEALVERFGKYHRKLGPGFHWILPPPLERISYHVTTREQVLDVPPQQCYTLDNAPLKADAVVYMRIVDVEMARYNVQDCKSAIMNLCLTQLREEVGKLTLDESFSSRERINQQLLKDLNAVCQNWGVHITRVELQNLEPSRDILAAMELQMAAERRKRAAILKSEGERTTMVNEAEGHAQAAMTNAQAQRQVKVLAAQAEADRQRTEADGIRQAIQTVAAAIEGIQEEETDGPSSPSSASTEAAVQFLSLIRYLETQSQLAASPNAKVIMLPSKDSLPLTYGGLKFLID